MYIIGLIDDEETQLKKIRRTIKTNAKANEKYDFKSYLISDNASDVSSEVFDENKAKEIVALIEKANDLLE